MIYLLIKKDNCKIVRGVLYTMKKFLGFGIIVLLIVLLIPPVAGWHATVNKSGPGDVYTDVGSVTYTIDATSGIWNLYKLEITDTLPQHLVFDSVISSWPDKTVDTSQAGKVVITLFNVPENTDIQISLVLKPDVSNPPVPGQIVNNVSSRVKGCESPIQNEQCSDPLSNWEGYRSPAYNPEGSVMTVITTFLTRPVVVPIASPEFPTAALPAAFIAGLLGLVIFIKRN